MDGSLVVMEGSLLSRLLLLQWMVALSLLKVDFIEIYITPMDGSLVIIEGILFSRFLLLQWIVAFSLWKVVYCRYLLYSNGW